MKTFICISAFTLVIACVADEAADILYEANNRFTALLMAEAEKQNRNSDIVISGFSVLQPLAQIGLASNGRTRDELLKVAEFADSKDVEKVYPNVNTNLQSVEGIELKLASRIYVGQLQINEEFKDTSKQMFGSEFQNLDFSDGSAAAQEINSWVEEQTNNKIKELVNPGSLGEGTAAVLVNAIYFKGKFRKRFPVNDTKPLDFYVNKKTIIQKPTMRYQNDFKYGESLKLDAQILELDYDAEESSLLIVLPKDVEGLPKLLNQLQNDPISFAAETQNLEKTTVSVNLPKFKVDTETNLKTALKNVGVNDIFEENENNFRNLLETNSKDVLWVTQAIQKAFIEVNEEGAEAAAANAFHIEVKSSSSGTTKFWANHPFYFAVKVKNTVLFSGVVKFNSKATLSLKAASSEKESCFLGKQ